MLPLAAGHLDTPMTIDEYLAAQPEPARSSLLQVRDAIRSALPSASESISYNMPTYKIGTAAVIYFAGWKNHYSLYPIGPAIQLACQTAMAKYKVEKSTIRFPLSAPVPVKLIQRITKLRALFDGP
eukprot:TRINITY_DN58344_c0_g1_i2.p1 TRINITY_DN58344_c0_g1~~TRINITY_DN58344_c0_g1_i2.p1  ORF type:complete len:126 (-),score=15.32 TRINITY_DN58344_c0_g1_i2:16-393(-)